MSIFGVTPADLDYFALETNPRVHFQSGSTGNTTGRVYVHPRRSSSIKEEKGIGTSPFFNDSTNGDRELKIEAPNWDAGVGLLDRLEGYLSGVNSTPGINPYRDVKRLTPEYSGSHEYANHIKSTVVDCLMPAYNHVYVGSENSYTNYHCINFISSSATPSNSALIFCNVDGSLSLTEDFTVNFHINVRNKYASPRPGTIIHIPGNLSISVIEGSEKDDQGRCVKYGLQVQLGNRARARESDSPTNVTVNDGGLSWTFDNVLVTTHWHDVTITWDSTPRDQCGHLYVDGELISGFGDLENPQIFIEPANNRNTPHLIIGNFCEGPDLTMSDFFSQRENLRGGLGLTGEQVDALGGSSDVEPGTSMTFNHVGYFELHDVNISRKVLTYNKLDKTPTTFANYVFYLAPFFTTQSNESQEISGRGGVMVSLAASSQTGFSTSTPYNLMLSHGSGCHLINLPNHLSDCVNPKLKPYLLGLTATTLGVVSEGDKSLSADDLLYREQLEARANNLLIMPCDDGTFHPRFNGVSFADEKIDLSNFVKNSGDVTSYVVGESLSNVIWGQTKEQPEAVLAFLIGGPTPVRVPSGEFGFMRGGPHESISPGGQFQEWLNNYQDSPNGQHDRTFPGAHSWKFFDTSSREVVMFEVSNLYYGDRIQPGTVVLTDTMMTGSGGQVAVTLKDDGFGNLYRADSTTTVARFNNVGNVFYDEGVVIIKSPLLYHFGKDFFRLDCSGLRNVHITKFNLTAPRNMLNSSSNPTYTSNLRPTDNPIDYDENFVYISGFNLHDDNFNVVARAKLAQPILKRDAMKIGFRMKIDF